MAEFQAYCITHDYWGPCRSSREDARADAKEHDQNVYHDGESASVRKGYKESI